MKNFSSWVQPIASAVLAAALVMLGLNLYVVPQIAELQAEGRGAAGTTQFTSAVRFREAVTAERDLTVTGALSAADLAASDDLTVTDDTTLSGDLSLEGIVFSGPVTFGTATNVISGTTIAHGLGVTPTVALVASQVITGPATLTQTVYILSTNTTSITVGLSMGSLSTIPVVNWIAGK